MQRLASFACNDAIATWQACFAQAARPMLTATKKIVWEESCIIRFALQQAQP
jgi:hypothetical protein